MGLGTAEASTDGLPAGSPSIGDGLPTGAAGPGPVSLAGTPIVADLACGSGEAVGAVAASSTHGSGSTSGDSGTGSWALGMPIPRGMTPSHRAAPTTAKTTTMATAAAQDPRRTRIGRLTARSKCFGQVRSWGARQAAGSPIPRQRSAPTPLPLNVLSVMRTFAVPGRSSPARSTSSKRGWPCMGTHQAELQQSSLW